MGNANDLLYYTVLLKCDYHTIQAGSGDV